MMMASEYSTCNEMLHFHRLRQPLISQCTFSTQMHVPNCQHAVQLSLPCSTINNITPHSPLQLQITGYGGAPSYLSEYWLLLHH